MTILRAICPAGLLSIGCGIAHACPSTGFDNGTSHWMGEMARADAVVGRPLRMPIPDRGGHGFFMMHRREGGV